MGKAGLGRSVAVALIVGMIVAWGGVSDAGAAVPSNITTCTKASTGRTTVIVASAVAKCTSHSKGVARSWADPSGQLGLVASLDSQANALRIDASTLTIEDCDALTYLITQLDNGSFEDLRLHPGYLTNGAAMSERCNAGVPAVSFTALASTLTTCTKTSNGKTKVIAASAAPRCRYNGKSQTKQWYSDLALTYGVYAAGLQQLQLQQRLIAAHSEQCGLVQAITEFQTTAAQNSDLQGWHLATEILGSPTITRLCNP